VVGRRVTAHRFGIHERCSCLDKLARTTRSLACEHPQPHTHTLTHTHTYAHTHTQAYAIPPAGTLRLDYVCYATPGPFEPVAPGQDFRALLRRVRAARSEYLQKVEMGRHLRPGWGWQAPCVLLLDHAAVLFQQGRGNLW
jgi:hypothetical protein